jgi:hypothetical protein
MRLLYTCFKIRKTSKENVQLVANDANVLHLSYRCLAFVEPSLGPTDSYIRVM